MWRSGDFEIHCFKTAYGVSGHLVFFTAKPSVPITSVVSSRLGRTLESQSTWFQAVRAICSRLAAEHHCVLNVTGTTTSRFLHRAATLFATPQVVVHLPAKRVVSLESWWQTIEKLRAAQTPSTNDCDAFVSPAFRLESWDSHENVAQPHPDVPLQDLVTHQLADQMYALLVKPKGNVDRLLRHRLSSQKSQTRNPTAANTHLCMGENLTQPQTRDELLDLGAVGWLPFASPAAVVSTETPQPATSRKPLSELSDSIPLSKACQVELSGVDSSGDWPMLDEFLTHCTRRRVGPWPSQSEESHLDDVILHRSGQHHSPLNTLQRIIEGRRLIASNDGIRGKSKVVCFTAVPLEELCHLRVFRAHRGRWDFEPYGIRIRRAALQRLAQSTDRYEETLSTESSSHPPTLGPVIYAEDWDAMPESIRPFFQKSHSDSKDERIDWSTEQEWRFLGDVDLGRIGPDDAVIFVPTREEAELLRHVSPWPVTVLPAEK